MASVHHTVMFCCYDVFNKYIYICNHVREFINFSELIPWPTYVIFDAFLITLKDLHSYMKGMVSDRIILMRNQSHVCGFSSNTLIHKVNWHNLL